MIFTNDALALIVLAAAKIFLPFVFFFLIVVTQSLIAVI